MITNNNILPFFNGLFINMCLSVFYPLENLKTKI